jgi:hypothetical protein
MGTMLTFSTASGSTGMWTWTGDETRRQKDRCGWLDDGGDQKSRNAEKQKQSLTLRTAPNQIHLVT